VKHLGRTLRRQQTRAEQLLWSRLRNRQLKGCKFRRQQVIGPDIVDSLRVQPRLVIEVNGGQHAETTLQDAQRTEYLQRLGYQVVRYWNDPVVGDVEAVMESIRAALIKIPSPRPSPGGRGG
jgi:very-short-patch-repair endonuclease